VANHIRTLSRETPWNNPGTIILEHFPGRHPGTIRTLSRETPWNKVTGWVAREPESVIYSSVRGQSLKALKALDFSGESY